MYTILIFINSSSTRVKCCQHTNNSDMQLPLTILTLIILCHTVLCWLPTRNINPPRSRLHSTVLMSNKDGHGVCKAGTNWATFFCSSMLLFQIIGPAYAIEQQYKLPPIDRKDVNRCQLLSSSIGQANAARDKLYDLRECDLRGQSGAGKDMSGMSYCCLLD